MTQENSPDLITEYLRLALPMMAKHGIPVTPENYAVWYAYVAGENESLREEIDAISANQSEFNQDVNEQLFRNFISECDIERFSKIRGEVAKIIRELGASIASADTDTSHFSGQLDGFVGKVTESRSLHDIRGMMQSLIDETRQMRESTAVLKDHFDQKSQEIAQLQEELNRERRKSSTDALTGLANRLSLFDAVKAAIDEEDSTPPCILMIDIDHFKAVNDTHGHLIGDRVIRFVAGILEKGTKGSDTAARYGGEEFAVLLPDTPIQGAMALAEKIRKTVAESKLVRSDTKASLGKVTVSIGVSLYSPTEDISEFIDRADRALYLSKNNGRNLVTSEENLSTPEIQDSKDSP